MPWHSLGMICGRGEGYKEQNSVERNNGSEIYIELNQNKTRIVSGRFVLTPSSFIYTIAECLADFTAQSVQSIHKLGQLLLITATAVRQENFSNFLSLIGRRISFYSDQFAQQISSVDNPGEEVCIFGTLCVLFFCSCNFF